MDHREAAEVIYHLQIAMDLPRDKIIPLVTVQRLQRELPGAYDHDNHDSLSRRGEAIQRITRILTRNRLWTSDQRIGAAQGIARRVHEGVKRDFSSLDYIKHPNEVADELRSHLEAHWERLHLDTETAIDMIAAAWVHDAVEDAEKNGFWTRQKVKDRIEAECGSRVLSLVLELTNQTHGSNDPRDKRKRVDREKLARASKQAKVIKMIDRMCNVREMKTSGHGKQFMQLYAYESELLIDVIGNGDPTLAHRVRGEIEALNQASK